MKLLKHSLEYISRTQTQSGILNTQLRTTWHPRAWSVAVFCPFESPSFPQGSGERPGCMRNTVPLHTSLHTLPHCFVAHFSTERCELLNGWGAPGGDAWELLLPGKQRGQKEDARSSRGPRRRSGETTTTTGRRTPGGTVSRMREWECNRWIYNCWRFYAGWASQAALLHEKTAETWCFCKHRASSCMLSFQIIDCSFNLQEDIMNLDPPFPKIPKYSIKTALQLRNAFTSIKPAVKMEVQVK